MTLICVRLDNSFSYPRITALADSRSTREMADGTLVPETDLTVKLFSIPIRCHNMNSLTPIVGSWTNPYDETLIGIGFTGHCFEALTLVALIARALSSLAAPDGGAPTPTVDGIINLIAAITSDFFGRHHNNDNIVCKFVVFGYENSKPWIGNVQWIGPKRAKSKQIDFQFDYKFACDDLIVCLGMTGRFEQYASELIDRIRTHKEAIKPSNGEDAAFDLEKEKSRHDLAEARTVEERLLKVIEDEYIVGVGGRMQRLELGLHEGDVVAGFTEDATPQGSLPTLRLDNLSGNALVPMPLTQKMGR